MTLPEALLLHAWELLEPNSDDNILFEVKLRRAVSGAYYAVFHLIISDAVQQLAPNVPTPINHRIRRWFNHAEMKAICQRFLPVRLRSPLSDLVGESASADMQVAAKNFIELQEARHKADYDLSDHLSLGKSYSLLTLAEEYLRCLETSSRLSRGQHLHPFPAPLEKLGKGALVDSKQASPLEDFRDQGRGVW